MLLAIQSRAIIIRGETRGTAKIVINLIFLLFLGFSAFWGGMFFILYLIVIGLSLLVLDFSLFM